MAEKNPGIYTELCINALIDERKRRKITQKAMAAYLGVSTRTYSALESDKPWGFLEVCKAAQLLGMKVHLQQGENISLE